MIDISFVQNNLPTPEEQLLLFKLLLENRDKDKLYTFNWVNNIENIKPRDIQRLDLATQLDSFSVRYFDMEDYLTRTIQNMFRELSLTLIWQLQDNKKDTVNIFRPNHFPYLIPSQYGQRLYLNGTIQFYFDN